jgi:hypothetical protein
MTTIDPEQVTVTTPVGGSMVDGSADTGVDLPAVAATADVAADDTASRATVTGIARWRDAAVGAAFEAQDATGVLITALRRTAAQRTRWVDGLAARGAAEQERGRRRAAASTQSAVTAIARSPVVDRVVDAQLERLLRPVVLTVLDDVLRLLEQEPERIQALIRGQREGMVDELVGRLRTGAATGDTAVDRFTFRVFHRAPRPTPPPPIDGT